MAAFVETFARVLGDPALPHLFFVEGGALAVENALKTAFDWKQQHNALHGRPRGLWHEGAAPAQGLPRPQRLHALAHQHRSGEDGPLPHVRLAAHRRSGDPVPDGRRRGARRPRTGRWRRPGPRSRRTRTTSRASSPSRSRARAATTTCAPSSSRRCRRCATRTTPCFVLDEVQTGCGMTGTAWAYQQLGRPAGHRGVRQEAAGVRDHGGRPRRRGARQRVPGALANQLDVGRGTHRHGALPALPRGDRGRGAGGAGRHARQAAARRTCGAVDGIDNVRGRGLFVAFDLPSPQARAAALHRLHRDEKVLVLGGGERSIRLRPALTIGEDELDLAVAAIARAVAA